MHIEINDKLHALIDGEDWGLAADVIVNNINAIDPAAPTQSIPYLVAKALVQYCATKDAAIEAMQDSHDQEITDSKAKQQRALDALKEQYDAQLLKREETHAAEKQQIAAHQAAQIGELKNQHAAAIQAMQDQLDSLKTAHAAAQQEAQARHAQELAVKDQQITARDEKIQSLLNPALTDDAAIEAAAKREAEQIRVQRHIRRLAEELAREPEENVTTDKKLGSNGT